MGIACKLIHTKSWGILDAPNVHGLTNSSTTYLMTLPDVQADSIFPDGELHFYIYDKDPGPTTYILI